MEAAKMTTTYDPHHPSYFDEHDLRGELERVYDLCHGCRLCFNLCPSFPTLFDLIDGHDGNVGAMSPAEQDEVVDECYQCKLCYVKCPYVPPHEWQLDFPRLMMRAHAVKQKDGGKSLKEKASDQFLARTDLLGKLSTMAAPIVNALTGPTGTLARKAMQATAGIHAERLLPPYAKVRFTSWFKKRPPVAIESPVAEVSVFPTCFVEYMEPEIGQDVVKVFEHNKFACSVPDGTRCCGAPWLHQGNIENFTKAAEQNIAVLAREVRAGRDIIVTQPTCAYIVKEDYRIYAPGPDAELVSAHTFDPSEYLINQHRKGDGSLDTEFPGPKPESVAYHLACHLRAQNIGFRGRDLMALMGTKIEVIERCSGIDGTWGYREENYELARKVARPLARAVSESGADEVCGDCHLANTAILQETGRKPQHPLQLIARAYNLPEG
jgi:Fe-S oxidoreductase